jgi:hypothetical protein
MTSSMIYELAQSKTPKPLKKVKFETELAVGELDNALLFEPVLKLLSVYDIFY